jgi:hypothetical protein
LGQGNTIDIAPSLEGNYYFPPHHCLNHPSTPSPTTRRRLRAL